MVKKHYEPPKQGGVGQFFDTIFLLALVYATLFAPLVFGLTGSGTTTEKPDTLSWETLGQNQTMAGQWEKLGFTPESAADIITTRFNYTVDPITLALTAFVIIGYFWFVLRTSDKEYRQVIAEKFGPRSDQDV